MTEFIGSMTPSLQLTEDKSPQNEPISELASPLVLFETVEN